ncbi:EF-1 guanine nucleotide exchange domain-containing protein, partial [Thraustotheca clavata]
MQFNDVHTDIGLKKLNGFLTAKSYVEGYQFSAADSALFAKIPSTPEASKYPNVYRWYVHVAAKLGRAAFTPKPVAATKPATPKAAAKPAKKEEEEDDDDDLFGDDDDEEEDEAAKAAAKK